MICSRPNCTNQMRRNGLCQKHYASASNTERGRIRADVIRDHITRLRNSGMSIDQIAEDAGMTGNGLLYIIQRGKWVRRQSAAAILAVTVNVGPSRVVVDATGSSRRIAALMRIGWSQRAIAREAGLSQGRIWNALHRDAIAAATAERIRRAFDRLHMTPGPSEQSVKFAIRQGFPPPLAWDEESIDDPAATPAPGWNVRNRRAELLEDVAERREQVRRLTKFGLSAPEIADRLGLSPRHVVRYRRELERAS